VYALLARYYPGFTPEVVDSLTDYQVQVVYLANIPELEKLFAGKPISKRPRKSKRASVIVAEMKRAEKELGPRLVRAPSR